MTLDPEEFSHAATMAAARARLELALGDPSPEVAKLLLHLAHPGGKEWADAALSNCFGSATNLAERVNARPLDLAEKAVNEPDARTRLLLGLGLGAAHLVARGELPPQQEQGVGDRVGDADALLESAARAQVTVDDLLDIASFLPEQWCDLFARAARIMRGDMMMAPMGSIAHKRHRTCCSASELRDTSYWNPLGGVPSAPYIERSIRTLIVRSR